MSAERIYGCINHKTQEIIPHAPSGIRIKLSKISEIKRGNKNPPHMIQVCALDKEIDLVSSLIDDGELKTGDRHSGTISCNHCDNELSIHLRLLKGNRGQK